MPAGTHNSHPDQFDLDAFYAELHPVWHPFYLDYIHLLRDLQTPDGVSTLRETERFENTRRLRRYYSAILAEMSRILTEGVPEEDVFAELERRFVDRVGYQPDMS